jgi:eukaryotic-like serine/threonine-protein kinase
MRSCRAASTRSTARERSPCRSRELGCDPPALLSTVSAGASARILAAAPEGELLGRYRIERELGAGAMGLVHAAVDLDLERRVALKVLRSDAPGPSACERLLREARAMARLAHPNVVTVYDVGATGGRGFVAMELIDGETLAEWLDAGDRPLAAILDAFLAAGRGLAAAHAAGIVHRDFKPRNVLRSRGGRIAVTDFGLAREIDAAPPAVDQASSAAIAPRAFSLAHKLTATGSLLGTPAYMAPEQWRGADITPATDQFAYCVALWEAIAGERPFPGDRGNELCAQIARGPAASGARRIPRRIRSVLRRGLDPDPMRRWPSMVALLEQLAPRRRARSGIPIARAVLFGAIALAVARRGSDAPEPVCARATNGAACRAPCELATERPAAMSRMAATRPSTCAPLPASPPRTASRRPETCRDPRR